MNKHKLNPLDVDLTTPAKLARYLLAACDQTIYISETDSVVKELHLVGPFVTLDESSFRLAMGLGVFITVVTLDFDAFFAQTVANQPNQGWEDLKAILDAGVLQKTIFKTTQDDIAFTYYAVGVASNNDVYGIKFDSVET